MRKYIHFFRKYTCIFAILLSCTNTLADENVITQILPPCRADIPTECEATNPENLCDNKVYDNGTCYLCGDDLDKDGKCNTINTKVKCNPGYEFGLIPGTNTYNCKPCTGGYYCPDGEQKKCPANTYSTSGATECTKCPDEYPNTGGNIGAASINSCYAVIPAGKYIKDNYLLDCLAGFYCEGKTLVYYDEYITEQGIEKCPAGSYCPAGSAEPTECPAGYYCPDGKTKIKCDTGYYCPAGSAEQTQCPAGYYCPDSETKTACPAGTYNPNTGSTSILECNACPAGTYNPNTGSTSIDACTKCKAGTYNPNTGSTSIDACTKCDAGTYSTTGQSQCTTCDAGYYCIDGARAACPAGTTSNAKAETKDYCFIKGDKDGTKFCTTQYGCFTIPLNIYNNNQSTN